MPWAYPNAVLSYNSARRHEERAPSVWVSGAPSLDCPGAGGTVQIILAPTGNRAITPREFSSLSTDVVAMSHPVRQPFLRVSCAISVHARLVSNRCRRFLDAPAMRWSGKKICARGALGQ